MLLKRVITKGRNSEHQGLRTAACNAAVLCNMSDVFPVQQELDCQVPDCVFLYAEVAAPSSRLISSPSSHYGQLSIGPPTRHNGPILVSQ